MYNVDVVQPHLSQHITVIVATNLVPTSHDHHQLPPQGAQRLSLVPSEVYGASQRLDVTYGSFRRAGSSRIRTKQLELR